MQRTTPKKDESLSTQMKRTIASPKQEIEPKLDGNFDIMTSTSSTLLDLAISGSRVHGGGLPGGILIEAFGPSQSGKTALLCEIAGNVQRAGGDVQFQDPEARLDQEYFGMYGMKIKEENYHQPDTVTQVFKKVRDWVPETEVRGKVVHGIFADSLAALSTDMEMENEDGDKMGGRRAKEFSEQLRKTCREIKAKNYLLVCSNQIRMKMDAQKFESKFTTSGGEAVKFYASVRMKFNNPDKVWKEVTIAGKKVKKCIGITTEIEVVKTVDKPYRKAEVTFLFDYGIDNIRMNLQFCKDNTKNTTYTLGHRSLSNSMEEAIRIIEKEGLEKQLEEQTIDLWEDIESKFASERKPKR
jgi:protein RecA